jgi:hypothetical protein
MPLLLQTCGQNCAVCDLEGVCVGCLGSYALGPTGDCIKCTSPLCYTCNYKNVSECYNCFLDTQYLDKPQPPFVPIFLAQGTCRLVSLTEGVACCHPAACPTRRKDCGCKPAFPTLRVAVGLPATLAVKLGLALPHWPALPVQCKAHPLSSGCIGCDAKGECEYCDYPDYFLTKEKSCAKVSGQRGC